VHHEHHIYASKEINFQTPNLVNSSYLNCSQNGLQSLQNVLNCFEGSKQILLTLYYLAEKPLKFLEVLNKYQVLNYIKTCAVSLLPGKPSKARGLFAFWTLSSSLGHWEQVRGGTLDLPDATSCFLPLRADEKTLPGAAPGRPHPSLSLAALLLLPRSFPMHLQ
jgi:hypothetical protein